MLGLIFLHLFETGGPSFLQYHICESGPSRFVPVVLKVDVIPSTIAESLDKSK